MDFLDRVSDIEYLLDQERQATAGADSNRTDYPSDLDPKEKVEMARRRDPQAAELFDLKPDELDEAIEDLFKSG